MIVYNIDATLLPCQLQYLYVSHSTASSQKLTSKQNSTTNYFDFDQYSSQDVRRCLLRNSHENPDTPTTCFLTLFFISCFSSRPSYAVQYSLTSVSGNAAYRHTGYRFGKSGRKKIRTLCLLKVKKKVWGT